MNKKKCIIFDFGGTLDTDGVHWSVMYSQFLERHGLNFTSDNFSKAFIKSDIYLKENSYRIIDYKTLLDTQINSIINELTQEDKHNYKNLAKIVLNDVWNEVINCLVKSKEILFTLVYDYEIGLVSNFYGNLPEICRDINISNYFKVILDSRNVGIEKPHPGIFSLAIKKLNTTPENVWVVGDSYDRDIVPTKILGCNTIWLKNKSWKEAGDSESADFIINNLNELRKIL